ncbi:MAG: monovalent cation/H(+) antiporter subunit G [Oscillospiraceae bacterium]|nr:monovalent cation/H(+) antiporter subunit G [Oscillospiraceae bacterium]
MILRIIIDVFIAAGFIFALAGTKGVIQMPDTYCRMQASTCITTLGVLGVVIGAALYAFCIMGSPATGIKVVVIGLLVITINPVGAHAIAKGAYRHGIRPEKEMEIDDFRRDFDE